MTENSLDHLGRHSGIADIQICHISVILASSESFWVDVCG